MLLINPRRARTLLAAGITAALLAPSAALAADDTTPLTGTLNAGQLTIDAPPAVSFSDTLNGGNDSYVLSDGFGSWSVKDATGTLAGWTVNVAASNVQYDGGAADNDAIDLTVDSPDAITEGVDTLTFGSNNFDPRGPGATVATADANEGAGTYTFGALASSRDNGAVELTLPYNAKEGAYTSTLTFTASSLLQ